MGEYTDTSVYYILYFPYFPVPQPVEKCIQLQLIQTELDPVIGVTTPCLVTIPLRLSLLVFSPIHLRRTAPVPNGTTLENPYRSRRTERMNGSSKGKIRHRRFRRERAARALRACAEADPAVTALLGGIAVSIHD